MNLAVEALQLQELKKMSSLESGILRVLSVRMIGEKLHSNHATIHNIVTVSWE